VTDRQEIERTLAAVPVLERRVRVLYWIVATLAVGWIILLGLIVAG